MKTFSGFSVFCVSFFCETLVFGTKNLSENIHSELIRVEKAFQPHRVYHLEDFFWTGSGDGSLEGEGWEPSSNPKSVPTVYYTTTVTSTLIIPGPTNDYTTHETDENTSRCVHDCDGPSTPQGEIHPTPTLTTITTTPNRSNDVATTERHRPSFTPGTERYEIPDQRYWLLTILQTRPDGSDSPGIPESNELESRLADLYQIAFQRQQERHFGLDLHAQNRSKRSTVQPNIPLDKDNIQVQIHNITALESNEGNEVELLYSVRVGGQPVPAKTAAEDMALVSDVEVFEKLGFATRTKAEPYIKEESKSLILSHYTENTWIYVSSVFIVLFLLLLLVTLLMGIRKKSSGKLIESPRESRVTQPVLRSHRDGETNRGFMEDAEVQTSGDGQYRRGHAVTPVQMAKSFARHIQNKNYSESESVHSSETESSQDSSPTTRFRWSDRRDESAAFQPLQSIDDVDYNEVIDATNVVAIRKADARSTNSYLSMPSVKHFPRGSIPEPLSRVLQPVSIRHLDEGPITPTESPEKNKKPLIRHGSMQEAEDPGVIGPLVWNQHCQRVQNMQIVMEKEAVDEVPNVGRMKKRFQELLDDAFSLFGSGSVSPEELNSPVQSVTPKNLSVTDARARSAFPRLSTERNDKSRIPPIQPRPKTSDPRRAQQMDVGIDAPRRAWGSGTHTPLIRPLSAGPFHRPSLAPHICPGRILPEGKLAPNDPAVPVIVAIKDELKKCTNSNKLPEPSQ